MKKQFVAPVLREQAGLAEITQGILVSRVIDGV